jgi:hypothetical protein
MVMKLPSLPFTCGFLFTAAALFLFNYASYVQLKGSIPGPNAHVHLWGGTAGFPLPFYLYSTGGIIGLDGFLTGGVVFDTLFVLVAAAAIGVCCHKFSRRNR